MSISTPGKGHPVEAGFSSEAPGNGEIIIEPVSVCNHVSTRGDFFFPT